MTVPDDYLVEHLFLLVGKNPLPVFVSAWIQAKTGGHVYLLYTKATEKVSGAIKGALVGEDGVRKDLLDQVFCKEIDSVDLVKIEDEIYSLVRGEKGNPPIPKHANAGLNYTGGTKPMVVHAYQALASHFCDSRFFYLDADTLQLHGFEQSNMQMDPGLIGGGKPIHLKQLAPVPIRDEKQISLKQMAALFDGTINIKEENRTLKILSQPAINVLIDLMGVKKNISFWQQWREKYLNWCQHRNRIIHEIRVQSGWKLAEIVLPEDEPFSKVTRALVGESHGVKLGEAAQKLGCTAGDLSDWLNGKWLEQYTWQCVNAIQNETSYLQEVYANIKPVYNDIPTENLGKPQVDIDFEIDVVAIRGCQLFVLSCTTSDDIYTNKHKLFEVFSRARTIGGDEARLAVVGTTENYKKVQTQLKEAWQTNQIRVFGRQHLADLTNAIKEWIENPNKNV